MPVLLAMESFAPARVIRTSHRGTRPRDKSRCGTQQQRSHSRCSPHGQRTYVLLWVIEIVLFTASPTTILRSLLVSFPMPRAASPRQKSICFHEIRPDLLALDRFASPDWSSGSKCDIGECDRSQSACRQPAEVMPCREPDSGAG